jgi:hypothetical protein
MHARSHRVPRCGLISKHGARPSALEADCSVPCSECQTFGSATLRSAPVADVKINLADIPDVSLYIPDVRINGCMYFETEAHIRATQMDTVTTL